MPASILLIEDNRDSTALIDYLLRAHGYAPRFAGNGAEGLRVALEQRPGMILLDIWMPEMNGFEVAAAARAHPELQPTRIVAVTASAMVGDRERIAAAGFDGYIPKPINPETFVGQVERFLGAPRPEWPLRAGAQ